MRKRIKLTESDIRRIVKQSVNKIVNEAHVIDKQFGISRSPGSFEAALVEAWKCAGYDNKKKLENAFPEYFPREEMYGSDDEPFDFRDFPHHDAYTDFYKGWKERHPNK